MSKYQHATNPGDRFGSLTVTGRPYRRRPHRVWVVECRCDCGAMTVPDVAAMVRGIRGSCTSCAHSRGLREAAERKRAQRKAENDARPRAFACFLCFDLAHRRPETGCPACGEAHEDHPPLCAEMFIRKLDVREVA